jgi:hypothetical protein
MVRENSELRARARLAQDKLANQFLDHPGVSLIDIGCAPASGEGCEDVVLRVHVRENWAYKSATPIPLPSHVDGFPVVVVRGNYTLETDELPRLLGAE